MAQELIEIRWQITGTSAFLSFEMYVTYFINPRGGGEGGERCDHLDLLGSVHGKPAIENCVTFSVPSSSVRWGWASASLQSDSTSMANFDSDGSRD